MTDELPQALDGLVVRPGDTLILRAHRDASRAQVDALSEAVKDRLPDIHVLVLGGIEQMAVYKPNS